MKRLITLGVIMAVLLAGGALTSFLIANGGAVLPVLQQVSAPDASPSVMEPWKANQFFLLVGFILFNLIGIAGTLAVIFWFVDRGIRQSKPDVKTESKTARGKSA